MRIGFAVNADTLPLSHSLPSINTPRARQVLHQTTPPDTSNLEMLRWVNLLANFAFYSGTDYKTTMGMGQTRRE